MDSIVNRGKQGYSLPIKNWLRLDLREYMTTLLNQSPLVHEYFDVAFVNTLIGEHLRRTHNHNHVLWALMNVGPLAPPLHRATVDAGGVTGTSTDGAARTPETKPGLTPPGDAPPGCHP